MEILLRVHHTNILSTLDPFNDNSFVTARGYVLFHDMPDMPIVIIVDLSIQELKNEGFPGFPDPDVPIGEQRLILVFERIKNSHRMKAMNKSQL
jgi:hypothetical protein